MANIYTDPVKIIELKESVLEDNNKDAQDLRSELKAQKTCLLNLMSGPGSGKTTTLLALDKYLRGRLNWGVMEPRAFPRSSCTQAECAIWTPT